MKRILILGGSTDQIPIITKAKELGHYVIVCDLVVDNPGRDYADEFYSTSTANKEAVLELAKTLKIDGIINYVSDLNANTAAFVADELGLPGNPPNSVKILSNKELFRRFLRLHHFNVPRANAYDSIEESMADFHNFKLPVMIKPVDSAGSKGVSKLDSISLLKEKAEQALKHSRVKRFIIEEFIECNELGHIGGEGFSENGKLIFSIYYNYHFFTQGLNPFVPLITTFPSTLAKNIKKNIDCEIQRLLDLLEMKTGAYNFEIRIDRQGKIYIMEFAPRNGGGDFQKLVQHTSKFKLNENIINGALGLKCTYPKEKEKEKEFWLLYVLHSQQGGIFDSLEINVELRNNNLVEYHLFVKQGDKINPLSGAHESIGNMFLKFATQNDLLTKKNNLTDLVSVVVRKETSVI